MTFFQKFGTLILVMFMNYSLMEKLSILLNEYSDYIDDTLINTVNDNHLLTNEETIRIIIATLFKLDHDKKIMDDYLQYMFQELDIKDYINNPYIKNIKLENVKQENWEIKELSYKPFELFVYDDLKKIGSNIIPSVGFFNEEYTYPAIMEDNRIWMLITPNEINTMTKPINKSFGKVLTIGLGMGYFAYMTSLKEEVESVTIIESNQTVIDIFVKFILPQFKNRDKITIIQDDAFHYLENNELDYDYIFIDIWHDPSDGCELYKRFKSYEQPEIIYDYWIENTIKFYLKDI